MLNELIKQAQAGNIESRNEIIVQHGHVIDKVLYSFRRNNIDESTKRYGALLGLMAAIENFDETKSNFATYAFVCARSRAQREMSKDWLIRHPNEKMNKVSHEWIRITAKKTEKKLKSKFFSKIKEKQE
jgi:DNA-directed RNA polymerase specialized sigma subunit